MDNNNEESFEKVGSIIIESGVNFIRPKVNDNSSNFLDRINNALVNSRVGRILIKRPEGRFSMGLAGYLFENTNVACNLSPSMMISITKKIHEIYSHDFVTYYTGTRLLDVENVRKLNDTLMKFMTSHYVFGIITNKEIVINTITFIEEVFENTAIQEMHTENSTCDKYITIYYEKCKSFNNPIYD